MREIEEEVREEFKLKYSQNGLNSPRTINSGVFSTIEAEMNLSNQRSGISVGDIQGGTLETKLAIRNEIRKKEKLLEVRNKQKLANERKKLRTKMQEEFDQLKEDLLAQMKEERLELSR
jgi:phenylalanyl-tRNA synthetase alpha subunit